MSTACLTGGLNIWNVGRGGQEELVVKGALSRGVGTAGDSGPTLPGP